MHLIGFKYVYFVVMQITHQSEGIGRVVMDSNTGASERAKNSLKLTAIWHFRHSL